MLRKGNPGTAASLGGPAETGAPLTRACGPAHWLGMEMQPCAGELGFHLGGMLGPEAGLEHSGSAAFSVLVWKPTAASVCSQTRGICTRSVSTLGARQQAQPTSYAQAYAHIPCMHSATRCSALCLHPHARAGQHTQRLHTLLPHLEGFQGSAALGGVQRQHLLHQQDGRLFHRLLPRARRHVAHPLAQPHVPVPALCDGVPAAGEAGQGAEERPWQGCRGMAA